MLKCNNCWHFKIYDHDIWVEYEKSFITLGPGSCCHLEILILSYQEPACDETNEFSVTFCFLTFGLLLFFFSSAFRFFFGLHDNGFFPFAFFLFFFMITSSSPNVAVFNRLITFMVWSEGITFLACLSTAVCFEKSVGDSRVIVLNAM